MTQQMHNIIGRELSETRMKYWYASFFLLLFIFFFSSLCAQVPKPQPYGDSILWKHLEEDLLVLTSDSLEGREAGTLGELRAANYIEKRFHAIGLLPVVPNQQKDSSYRQVMEMETKRIENGWIKDGNQKWEHLTDIIFWGGGTQGRELRSSVIYAGGGTDTELKDLNVKNRIVMIKTQPSNIAERIFRLKEKDAKGCLVVTTDSQDAFEGQIRLFRLKSSRPEYRLSSSQTSLRSFPVAAISPQIASSIMGISGSKWRKGKMEIGTAGREVQLSIKQKRVKVSTYNMLGYIKGSDPLGETLILSAHYDHLGMRRGKIHPGADDNAGGVATLLAIAEAFQHAISEGFIPKRNIVFFACTAEEKGLLGSKYYSKHPIFPLKKTIANLNMDMIAHTDKAHQDNPRFVSIVGSDWLSSDLHQIHEQANAQYVGLELDYTYNSKKHPERFYYRSDQYNFAKHDIPVIFYTSGDHEDYHRPSDTIDHLSPERLEGVARLIFYTAWELGYREAAIEVDSAP